MADKLEIAESTWSGARTGGASVARRASLDLFMKIYQNWEEISLEWLLFGKESFHPPSLRKALAAAEQELSRKPRRGRVPKGPRSPRT
jgi:hypothetical protein